MESPALTADGAALRVGWIAWDDGGSYVLTATSTDDGATWSTPARLDATGGVFGHVPPRWRDGRLYWARLGASGEAEACRAAPDDAEDAPTSTTTSAAHTNSSGSAAHSASRRTTSLLPPPLHHTTSNTPPPLPPSSSCGRSQDRSEKKPTRETETTSK
jgi:hypothetical protein